MANPDQNVETKKPWDDVLKETKIRVIKNDDVREKNKHSRYTPKEDLLIFRKLKANPNNRIFAAEEAARVLKRSKSAVYQRLIRLEAEGVYLAIEHGEAILKNYNEGIKKAKDGTPVVLRQRSHAKTSDDTVAILVVLFEQDTGGTMRALHKVVTELLSEEVREKIAAHCIDELLGIEQNGNES